MEEKKIPLREDEMRNVTGGTELGYSGGFFCKYCGRDQFQIYKGIGKGWDTKGEGWNCHLYECQSCHCTNYYRVDNGVLI